MLPKVVGPDGFWQMKRHTTKPHDAVDARGDYEPIEMLAKSATGFVTAFFAAVTGFVSIWHIWRLWLPAR